MSLAEKYEIAGHFTQCADGLFGQNARVHRPLSSFARNFGSAVEAEAVFAVWLLNRCWS